MTALALTRRLDPCIAWFRLHPRTRGAIMWAFPGLLLGAWLGSLLKDGHVVEQFRLRQAQRSAHAPLLAEARRLGLAHERVVADPAAAVGKPVQWCVASGDGERGFVNHRVSRPVLWTSPSAELRSNLGGNSSYCFDTLAIVESVQSGVVRLRLVQKL